MLLPGEILLHGLLVLLCRDRRGMLFDEDVECWNSNPHSQVASDMNERVQYVDSHLYKGIR
jgi:hypothetical protein